MPGPPVDRRPQPEDPAPDIAGQDHHVGVGSDRRPAAALEMQVAEHLARTPQAWRTAPPEPATCSGYRNARRRALGAGGRRTPERRPATALALPVWTGRAEVLVWLWEESQAPRGPVQHRHDVTGLHELKHEFGSVKSGVISRRGRLPTAAACERGTPRAVWWIVGRSDFHAQPRCGDGEPSQGWVPDRNSDERRERRRVSAVHQPAIPVRIAPAERPASDGQVVREVVAHARPQVTLCHQRAGCGRRERHGASLTSKRDCCVMHEEIVLERLLRRAIALASSAEPMPRR